VYSLWPKSVTSEGVTFRLQFLFSHKILMRNNKIKYSMLDECQFKGKFCLTLSYTFSGWYGTVDVLYFHSLSF
jgi:hypothetical protein